MSSDPSLPETPTPIRVIDNESRQEAHAKKREQQRESLSVLSRDPFLNFSIPLNLRKRSAELNRNAADLENEIRKISSSSEPLNNNEEVARNYIKRRTGLVESAARTLKIGRDVLADLTDNEKVDKLTLKRTRDALKESELAVLNERAVLATEGAKFKYRMFANPNYVKAGEAYLALLAEKMELPKGATIKRAKRDPTDQASFRVRVRAAYNPPGIGPEGLPDWCPISKRFLGSELVKAAHIVPWAIGEENAAYLFGLNVEDGYTALWNTNNGLLMYLGLEAAFDDARIVIVPDGATEFKVIVLDETILNNQLGFGGVWYRDLHNKRLEFKTEARPGRRYLYFMCLLSLFRRRRYNVKGWQKDHATVLTGAIWGTPGKWLRRSILQLLAMEMGDAESLEDVAGKDNGAADFAGQASEEKERRIVVQIQQNVEVRQADNDEDEGDE